MKSVKGKLVLGFIYKFITSVIELMTRCVCLNPTFILNKDKKSQSIMKDRCIEQNIEDSDIKKVLLI